MKKIKTKRYRIGRDAKTGRFVTLEEAAERPNETVTETIVIRTEDDKS